MNAKHKNVRMHDATYIPRMLKIKIKMHAKMNERRNKRHIYKNKHKNKDFFFSFLDNL